MKEKVWVVIYTTTEKDGAPEATVFDNEDAANDMLAWLESDDSDYYDWVFVDEMPIYSQYHVSTGKAE